MKESLVILVAVAALAALPASATCVQCPSAPCEITECPPEEVPVFANITLQTVSTGIGGTVEVVEGTEFTIDALRIPDAPDDDAVEIDLSVLIDDEESFADGFSITAVSDRYSWSGTGWVYEGTSAPETIYTAVPSSSGNECAGLDKTCQDQNGCRATCAKATYCSEVQACLVTTSNCKGADWPVTCGTCGARTGGCWAFGIKKPIASLRTYTCSTGYQCTLRLYHVSENPVE